MSKNARFWTYHRGSFVKLTLKPDQALHHHRGGPTEEGWWSASFVVSHEGDHVRIEHTSDGCDCDGRLTTGADLVCPLDRLAAKPCSRGWPWVPDWQEEDSYRRDYQAEAAGY